MRDVVNHLVGMNLVFVAMFEESPMPERGVDCLGTDRAGAYHRSAAALQAAAARPGILERSRATPLGVATGAERLQWRIADLLVHGWDLAQATGIASEPPDDLVEQALTFVGAQLPGQPRAGRFGDPQPIPDNAPAPSTGWRRSPAGRSPGRREGTDIHVFVNGVMVSPVPAQLGGGNGPGKPRARVGMDPARLLDQQHDLDVVRPSVIVHRRFSDLLMLAQGARVPAEVNSPTRAMRCGGHGHSTYATRHRRASHRPSAPAW